MPSLRSSKPPSASCVTPGEQLHASRTLCMDRHCYHTEIDNTHEVFTGTKIDRSLRRTQRWHLGRNSPSALFSHRTFSSARVLLLCGQEDELLHFLLSLIVDKHRSHSPPCETIPSICGGAIATAVQTLDVGTSNHRCSVLLELAPCVL